MVTKYDLLIFLLLDHKLNKEMGLSNPFGHACAPLGTGLVIQSLRKVFFQPPLPLQVMIQLRGQMDLSRTTSNGAVHGLRLTFRD